MCSNVWKPVLSMESLQHEMKMEADHKEMAEHLYIIWDSNQKRKSEVFYVHLHNQIFFLIK